MDVSTSFPENRTTMNAPDPPNCIDEDMEPPWLFLVVPAYIYIISALGILLNLLVLLVFLLHKKSCSATEIYLSNMAAADLLLVVFLPFWGTYVANGYAWTIGGPMCIIVTLLINVNYNGSIYFLILVCADRFLALVHPLSQCKLRRRKYAKMSCAAVWCFGLLLNIPTLMCRQARVPPFPYNETANLVYTCEWTCSKNVYLENEIIQAIVAFVIPLLIISFFTVQILKALKERPREGVSNQKSEHKVTILVLSVLLAFIICWLPFRINKLVHLAVTFDLIKESQVIRATEISMHFTIYFGFFNSDLNPILYVIVGKNFRKKMWEVLRGRRSAREFSTQFATSMSMLSSQKLQVKPNSSTQ